MLLNLVAQMKFVGGVWRGGGVGGGGGGVGVGGWGGGGHIISYSSIF